MKYLVIFGIALLVIWIWKSNRRNDALEKRADSARPSKAAPIATEIVACEVCHVHLPRSEALAGPGGGVYCSDAHRQQASR